MKTVGHNVTLRSMRIGAHLLGVTLVGPGVTEMLHSATVAVASQVPVDRLWRAVLPDDD